MIFAVFKGSIGDGKAYGQLKARQPTIKKVPPVYRQFDRSVIFRIQPDLHNVVVMLFCRNF